VTAEHIPTAHEIETFTGRFVNVDNPKPETICLEDIAHALSQICRYGGHCKTFYSVAEHAVFVSKRLERQGFPKWLQLAGLHHDDAEAYLGDIPRPIKPLLGKKYEQMTNVVDTAIVDGLKLNDYDVRTPTFHFIEIKTADSWALFVEARKLLPSEGRLWWSGAQGADGWGLEDMPSRIVTPDYWQGGLKASEAFKLYINRHKELTT
jgi:hypothetical protein